jgi:hypothetical protein
MQLMKQHNLRLNANMSIMSINHLFCCSPHTFCTHAMFNFKIYTYLPSHVTHIFFQWIRSWVEISLQWFFPCDMKEKNLIIFEKNPKQCFWSNKSPFLFLGPIFNSPFSWPFWFFLPTYWEFEKIKNQFAIYFQLDFANMYACSNGQVGLNFSLLTQLLIHVCQHYVYVFSEGLLLVIDHGVVTQLLMILWKLGY